MDKVRFGTDKVENFFFLCRCPYLSLSLFPQMSCLMMEGKIIVMYPTRSEAEPFMLRHAAVADVWLCGIGAVACAARTAEAVLLHRPGFILLAGIAGARAESGLSKGETVAVVREHAADVGACRGEAFVSLPVDGSDVRGNVYENRTPVPSLFRSVESDTVSVAGTSLRAATGASVENMEGTGFFAVCGALGVPFAELRCISNYIGEERCAWRIEEAAERLAEDVRRFVDAVRAQL